jgi:hypothetical protein
VDGVNIAGLMGCVGEKARVSTFVGRITGKRVGVSITIGLTGDAGLGVQATMMRAKTRSTSRVVEVCTSLINLFSDMHRV